MALTHDQARAFYDRFGKKQDAQSFYEDAALDDLIAHASFGQANAVFELGCGTGRFALRLLEKHLPASATYLGIDLSQTMIDLAQQRLAPYRDRAKAVLSDGALHFDVPDHSVDRVVSTYVMDLLSENDIREAIAEAHRILMPGGKLCLVGLAPGLTFSSHIVSALWSGIYSMNANLVGGCRPVQLDPFFDYKKWTIDYRHVVTQFGVPSAVHIATPKPDQKS
ncbi:MAG: class I SAM-dependent methyltransferase [Gallionella sp.]|nr:class I SAM-dependent methyltransferase [Gallionella sp.]